MMRVAFAFLVALVAFHALPVLAQSGQDICEILTDEARMANEEAPLMVDDYTQEDSTAVSCTDKTMETKLTVVAQSVLPAGWQDQRQGELNALYCEDDISVEAMDTGWTFTQTIAMPDGTSVALTAACE
jgi:hypothetical protein